MRGVDEAGVFGRRTFFPNEVNVNSSKVEVEVEDMETRGWNVARAQNREFNPGSPGWIQGPARCQKIQVRVLYCLHCFYRLFPIGFRTLLRYYDYDSITTSLDGNRCDYFLALLESARRS